MSTETEYSSTKGFINISPAKWVRPALLPALFGITPEAARKYRERGFWLEGKHWRYDPVNKIVYCPSEIENWMEGNL